MASEDLGVTKCSGSVVSVTPIDAAWWWMKSGRGMRNGM